MSCDRCNHERARHCRFCSYCGADLSIPNGGAPCDFCSRSKGMGFTFCNVCGRELSSDPMPNTGICPGCDEYRNAGYRFCAICGRPVGHVHNVPARQPSGNGIRVSFILVSISVLLGIFVLLYEAYTGTVKVPYLMDALDGYRYTLFILTPKVTGILTIGDTAVKVLYIVELGIVLICLAYLFYSAFDRYLETGRHESLRETGLYEALCLNGMLFIFQIVYIMFCISMGAEIDTIGFDNTADAMFSLMNASVYEEFLCRICLLGLPIAIVARLLGDRDVPVYRYLIGGFGFRRWMWAFVLLSATFFALGHLGGWGMWKIVPTFLFGMMTAYLFIKYGVYATISIHFLTDFLQSELWLTGSDVSVTLTMMIFLSSVLALSAVPYYFGKVRRILSGLRSTDKRS